MKAKEFLSIYTSDGLIQTLAEHIRVAQSDTIHLKGLSGSLDAVVVAAVFKKLSCDHLIILHSKEEAVYFLNDMQSLLEGEEVLFFPMSYKEPYTFDEIENNNIIMRLETITSLNDTTGNRIIVTYPEALGEKVVKKKSLINNTFVIKKGSWLDSKKLEDFFHKHDFEQVDFVCEAGQFAIRGGIIDVFSFAHEFPYRIERFGNDVGSISRFDSDSQLSISTLSEIHLVPNIQTRLIQEDRQSFLDFISPFTRVWVKDVELISDVLIKNIDKATAQFETITQQSENSDIAIHPEQLFESASCFMNKLESYSKIEFGHRFYLRANNTIMMDSSAQMSFNKNFEILASSLASSSLRGYSNFICADMPKQVERLQGILDDINPESKFESLKFSLREGFVDQRIKINCYTDHQLFERFYQRHEKVSKSKAITLKDLRMLHPGDFVTHIDYGIGKFAGMEKKKVNGNNQESIRIVFRGDDILYANIHSLHKISKYTGREGATPVISKLGNMEWENRKARVKKKVKDIAKELIKLYAKRKEMPGYAFSPDGFMQAELESSFIYVDTPDQAVATEDVKCDMEAPHPMDRLICGDVGFGKTEIAIRAAFKAVSDGKQVAVLVPTTILALQHFQTFRVRLGDFPVSIEYISRFKSAKEVKLIFKNLLEGTINILIGTHSLTNKKLMFKNLGLLIIDEEQKFGVKAKEKLKELKVNVDVLTLTATPIPRTLNFSLMGSRDLSIITTPPSNRQAVTTVLHTYDEPTIRDAISREIQRKGQVFFVHNRVSNIEQIANTIFRLVPNSKIGIAHGQMEGNNLEKVMMQFVSGECDILVSTNIIESGLDIPNANTIIINQAHTFGLSDLHQMRGRVGRSNKKAFCYLLTPPVSNLSAEARKRLSTLEEFSNLGDGLKIAMRDLEIRGAGNILGAEQTGFINDIGFDAYHKILDDSIQELKEGEFKTLFAEELNQKVKPIVQDCIIETDLEVLIPDTYVKNTSERLRLYTDLNRIKDTSSLVSFRKMLRDRFGPIPAPVIQLINSIQLRWIGETIGIEKIVFKLGKLKMYFTTTAKDYFKSEIFSRVLEFIQANPERCRLKQQKGKNTLEIDAIYAIDETLVMLKPILKQPKAINDVMSL